MSKWGQWVFAGDEMNVFHCPFYQLSFLPCTYILKDIFNFFFIFSILKRIRDVRKLGIRKNRPTLLTI